MNEHDGVARGDFPKRFGRYVIRRPLARGGMGELYVATAGEPTGHQKLCVLKTALPPWVKSDIARALHEEATFAMRFDHPNIVYAFDAGTVDGAPYLAMELVRGRDLQALLKRARASRTPIPMAAAIQIVRAGCRALAHIHGAGPSGVVHRDIAPPNFLVGWSGAVKLTDFGLACSRAGDSSLKKGRVLGHLGYLSPEQARGEDATTHSDIYSLGVVLWELLTGRPLLPRAGGRDATAFASLRNPRIIRPSAVVRTIPKQLDEVVLASLEIEPSNRHRDADSFADALSSVARSEDFSLEPTELRKIMDHLFHREREQDEREYPRYSIPPAEPAGARGEPGVPHLLSEELSSSQDVRQAARNRIGLVLAGRYRLESVLAVGGMGAVYRAMHMGLDKSIAVKILHDVYRHRPAIVRRFIREGRAAIGVPHESFVDVFDVGQTPDGDPYFVMELLEGENLEDVITRERCLEIGRILGITRRIAEALSAAHDSGIIHRDLKPSNVVLTSEAELTIKVVDFGICKRIDGDSCPTTPGLIVGSPDYMAPEQAAGVDSGPALDIYALGCIIYEMSCGEPPFRGRTTLEVLMRKGSERAPNPQGLRPELPRGLVDLIESCLDRRASKRPESMDAVAGVLQQLEQDPDYVVGDAAPVCAINAEDTTSPIRVVDRRPTAGSEVG